MSKLNKFQRTVIILYLIFVLWITIFNVPWVLRYSREHQFQTREWSSVFQQPKRAYFPRENRELDVGYAYVDFKQIVTLLFTGTVVSGGLFILSLNTAKKEK
jgi:hypothetical protein